MGDVSAGIGQFIGRALGNVFGASLASGITGFIQRAAITAGITLIQRALSDRGGLETPALSLPERAQQVRLADAPRKVVYGTAQFAPAVAYVDTTDFATDQRPTAPPPLTGRVGTLGAAGTRAIAVVYAVCDHDLATIEALQIGGADYLTPAEITRLNGGSLINVSGAGDGTSELRQQAHDANTGDTANGVGTHSHFIAGYEDFGEVMDRNNLDIVSPGGAGWESLGMQGRNIFWLAAIFVNPLDQNKIKCWNQIPNVSLRVRRGNQGFATNPIRLAEDDTFNNPATCIYDYLQQYTAYGDDAFGQERIDRASFTAAYFYHNEKGHRIDGVFDLSNDPSSVLRDIIFAAPGAVLVDSGGTVYMRSGQQPTVATINEDDILDGWNLAPHFGRRDQLDHVSLRFARLDDATNIDVIDTVSVQTDRDPVRFSQAGLPVPSGRTVEMETSFIRGGDQAWEAAHYFLERHQQSFGITLDARPRLLSVIPGDVVQVDLPTLGIGGLFRVLSTTINADLSVRMNLAEEASGFYITPERDTYQPVYSPNTTRSGILAVDDGGVIKQICVNDTDRIRIITASD